MQNYAHFVERRSVFLINKHLVVWDSFWICTNSKEVRIVGEHIVDQIFIQLEYEHFRNELNVHGNGAVQSETFSC